MATRAPYKSTFSKKNADFPTNVTKPMPTVGMMVMIKGKRWRVAQVYERTFYCKCGNYGESFRKDDEWEVAK